MKTQNRIMDKHTTIERLIDIGFTLCENKKSVFFKTKHGYINIQQNPNDNLFYFYSEIYTIGKPLLTMKDVVNTSNILFNTTFNLYLNRHL